MIDTFVAESAARFCGARYATILRLEGEFTLRARRELRINACGRPPVRKTIPAVVESWKAVGGRAVV